MPPTPTFEPLQTDRNNIRQPKRLSNENTFWVSFLQNKSLETKGERHTPSLYSIQFFLNGQHPTTNNELDKTQKGDENKRKKRPF
jgi:hypothetical protein